MDTLSSQNPLEPKQPWYLSHKFWYCVLIVLLAIVVGGVWYYAQIQKEIAEALKNSNQQTNTVAPTQRSGQSDGTSDWKTYTNEQYGFEFKYPSDWILDTGKVWGQSIIVTTSSPETIKQIKDCLEGCGPDISFSYYVSLSEMPDIKENGVKASTLDEYVHNKDALIYNPNQILFAEQNGFDMELAGLSSYYTIMVEKDGHIFEILFNNAGSKAELNSAENQILSTFKFTNN